MSVETIVRAKAGEILVLEGEPHMIWSSCGAPTATLGCVTCGQQLANQGQLEMHTEHGIHVIAALCLRHGWESLYESPNSPNLR
jgi:hypothetical protein